MNTRQYLTSCIKLFSFLLTLAIMQTGCVNRPLLLRNRPNVPPPSLDPNSDNIPQSYARDVIENPPLVIGIENRTASTVISIPEIKHTPVTHEVKKGESFWKISRMYGVSKDELAECNNLSINKPLKIGTQLVIPPGGTYIPKEQRKPVRNATPSVVRKQTPRNITGQTASDGTYIVQPGDSLWKISRKFKISPKALIAANGIDSRKLIQPGMKLTIPGVEVAAASNPKPVKTTPMSPLPTADANPVKTTEPDPIDDLLKDAENAAGNATTGNAADVLDGLNNAAKTSENPLPDDLFTEEVLPNETLQEIAERHGLKVEDLLKVNPGLRVNKKLKPFSSIKIPNKQSF